MNYSFASAYNDNPNSNTDLPSNAPLGASQKLVIFSENGFNDAMTHQTDQSATANVIAPSANSLMKNNAGTLVIGSSFMTPAAWGSAGPFAFASISGTPYQTYASIQRQSSDFLGQIGLGVGNSQKFVSVVAIININDLSEVDNFSYSFSVSRHLGKLGSISAGALHLFADPKKTDAVKSYYLAYSHAIKKTKFSYTVGVGTGKFYENDDVDKRRGKTAPGTAVFANISYNIFKNIAVGAEWTGRNAAISSTVMIKPYLPVIAFGISELTRRSGDHPTFFISVGKGIALRKARNLLDKNKSGN